MNSLSLKIFGVFFKLSLISFGGVAGVLPELERILVNEMHWITHDQFIQSYTLAQFVPGPNMVMCPMIGYQINGVSGFLAGFIGIYLAPLLIMGAFFRFYQKYQNIESVKRIELALRPLVLGLLSSTAIQLWWAQAKLLNASSLASSIGLALVLSILGLVLTQRYKVGALKMLISSGLLVWGVHFFY